MPDESPFRAAGAPDFPLDGARVFVAGHRGMVGSAIARALRRRGAEILAAARDELDLRRAADTERWLRRARPDAVVVAAARVGGIRANAARPAEFLYDNLAIAASLIEGARRAAVAKLLFLGSSCIYPRLAPQPIPADALLTGPLEPTNEPYAIAKIAGIKLCQAYRRQYGGNFIAAMPCNLYGPGDNFDPASGHVIPALMHRMHRAKLASARRLEVWGTGGARREFLHVDDLAAAAVLLLQRYNGLEPVNVGTGRDLSVGALARRLAAVTGFRGRLVFDPRQPEGAPRKVLDVTSLHGMGWRARIGLAEGLADTYAWYLEHASKAAHPPGAPSAAH